MAFLSMKSLKTFVIVSLSSLCLFTQAYAAPSFSQIQIDDAMSKPLLGYTVVGSNPATVLSSQAFHYLALVTHFNPIASDSHGNPVKEKVLAHYRNLISGGKEPYCGQPLYAWSDGAVGQSLLILKNTPDLWLSLTSEEQESSDLLMKALAVGCNWAFNDQNNFHTGLGDQGNFQKTYNPNFVQGDIGIMIAAALYFGPDECNEIFKNFSYDQYMTEFKNRKWKNIVKNWSKTGKYLMEKGGTSHKGGSGAGVKVPFTYCGIPLSDLNGIFYATSVAGSPKPMYRWVVSNTGANGKAYILSDKPSPVLGLNGMCYEFDSIDGNGARSDALYCYEGWMNNLHTRTSMMLMGEWGGPHQSESESHMYVGTTDLIFKLQEGYHGAYLGKNRDVFDNGLPEGKGYFYNKDIWDNYVNAGGTPVPPSPATPTGPNITVHSGPLQISFDVVKDWGKGFSASVTVINTGTTPIAEWAISFNLPAKITSVWDAEVSSHIGDNYKITPSDRHKKIAPGGKVIFGFNAEPGALVHAPTNIQAKVQ